ncbi:MAG: hypothetical protein Q4G47_01820, partial [Lachnospiraceae bacterium]|nr:hypothetical protein [Lachnospiraceae bacterium]
MKKILDVAEEYKGMIQLLTDRESIVSASDITHMSDFQMEEYQETFDNVATAVPSMAAELEHHEAVPKVNIFFRTPEDREEGYSKLSGLPLTFAYA